MKRIAGFAVLSCCAVLLFAAAPPDILNYQGVLRNAADQPLDGAYDMVFRLCSAETGGDEILVDTHTGVTVSGGLFNVRIGGVSGGTGDGVVTDGSGPGRYLYLPKVFGDYPEVYLEIEVGGEILSPRTRMASAGYAMNARYVNGMEVIGGPLDIYVNAATGSDDNAGILAVSPFQTIQRAIDRVPPILSGPVTIHVADGTYNESVIADRRTMTGEIGWITIEGNVAAPQNVVLDGQGVLDTGIFTLGILEVRGIEVRNYTEEGLEVDWGWLIVSDCRVINNGTAGPGWTAGMAAYSACGLSVNNCLIANNAELGLHIGERAAKLEIENTTISGNGMHGIEVSEWSTVKGRDNLIIQNNGGIGVWARDNAKVTFGGSSTLTIQSNTGGSLKADYLSIIRGYGSGTTGSCVPDASSICEP